ncbi:lipid II flippase MurJ [Aliarcobacter cryaerophilus]|uniref:lipid II flippase MurJ n=1 Tax=Aliarcobacter cryaerophilus TaxID=28198 RepID=UPI0021B15CF7|nr:lipid II flippase MurJ [Aliarcobacter cryaerophilus]MCT7544575.1 hypothetical protein [Aliarcobacter cryaerophilus]
MSFINQIVYAYYFGADSSFDLLNALVSLPFSIVGIGSGAISLLIMPILNDSKKKYGDCKTTLINLIKKGLKYIIVISIIITMIQLYTFYDKVQDIYFNKFIKLTLLSGLFIFFTFLNTFFIIYFNFEKKFILASTNAMFIYIFSILLCVIFADTIGVDIVVYSLILSNIFLFLIFILNFGYLNISKINKEESKVNITSIEFFSSIFSILPFTLPVFIDSYFLLTLGDGYLSYVSYANKIIIMISSILVQPLNIILFPKILERKDDILFIKNMISKIYIFTFISFIIILLMTYAFFLDFMSLFFENGNFTDNDSQNVYSVFTIYLFGIIGMVCMNIQNKIINIYKFYKLQIILSILFLFCYYSLMLTLTNILEFKASGYSYAISWTLLSIIYFFIINFKLK